MKVVVSGATGFLGGHLCRHLKDQGHEVIGLGRDAVRGAELAAEGMEFHTVDLSRTARPPVDRADGFVHAAALSSNWGRRGDFEAANVDGTRNALDMAGRMGVRRFVFISSPTVAFRFHDQLNQAEGAPLPPPVNAYAASKRAAEVLVRAYPETVILRPRGLYGRGDTALLPRLIRAARGGALPLLNHGEAVTDLTHVDDAVRAVACALKAPDSVHRKTYNISGGEPVTIKSIIEQACHGAGVTPRFTSIPVGLAMAAARTAEAVAAMTPGRPEPMCTAYSVGVLAYSQTLDISAAAQDLGFVPEVCFAEGLKRTFA